MYIGSKIICLEKVGSTNEFLKSNTDIYPDGTVVMSKIQTAGRGRFKRKWASDGGNLYCSILLSNLAWIKTLTELPILIAVIIRRAIHMLVASPQLSLGFKWPNDILSPKGKCSGILIESVGDKLIVGIGVNIASAPVFDGVRTSCIRDICPIYKDLEPFRLLSSIVDSYNAAVDQYLREGFAPFRKEWEGFCVHINKKVALSECIDDNTTEKNTVLFKRLNDDGGALIVDHQGLEKTVYYGEIVSV